MDKILEGMLISLREENGNIYNVIISNSSIKIKGLGVFNPMKILENVSFGEQIMIGSKCITLLPPRNPELVKGMERRAQIIQPKDAGVLIAKMGIGSSSRVLEAGLGSAALALHISNVLGKDGVHVTVEEKDVHSEVGLRNLDKQRNTRVNPPIHHHISGRIEESINEILRINTLFDAIILDLPEHASAIKSVVKFLDIGGRIACYCPVTSQIETVWDTCVNEGLEIEWAGELIERTWGRASKGGIRPVNGPFGHTAFLLIAARFNKINQS